VSSFCDANIRDTIQRPYGMDPFQVASTLS
jgi:hypothetical protein